VTTTIEEKNTEKGLHTSRQWMKKTSKCVCNLRDASSFFFKDFFKVYWQQDLYLVFEPFYITQREREKKEKSLIIIISYTTHLLPQWPELHSRQDIISSRNKQKNTKNSLHVIRICRSRYICVFNLIFKMKKQNKKISFFESHHSLLLFFYSMISIQDNQYTHAYVYRQLYNQFIPKYDLYKAGQVEGGGNSVEVLFDSVGSLDSMDGLSSLFFFCY
jgi:hypothetical protein